MDTKFPTAYPAKESSGGDAWLKSLSAYASSTNSFSVHHNFIDMYPDSPDFNSSQVAYNSDKTPKKCWYNTYTNIQSQCTAADTFADIYTKHVPIYIAGYSLNSA